MHRRGEYPFCRPAAVMLVVAAAIVALPGCSKEGTHSSFVARVDQSILTKEHIEATTDSVTGLHRTQKEFVSAWVNSELLYQEALRRGVADTDEFRRQVESAKQQLAISMLLDKELYGKESPTVSDAEIAQVYTSSASQYLLREDVVHVSFALFADRDPANEFRSKLVRGASWSDAVAQAEKSPEMKSSPQQIATRQYFTQAALYPEELWKLARTLSKETVSYVVKTQTGHYVLMVHGWKKQGEVPDLEYVRDEIRDRLLIERRRTKYEQLLTELRMKHTVDVHMEYADTSAGAKD